MSLVTAVVTLESDFFEVFTNVLNDNHGSFGKNTFTLAFVINFPNFCKKVTFRKKCKKLAKIGLTK